MCIKDRTGHFGEGDPAGEFCGEVDINDNGLGIGLRVNEPVDEPDEDRGIQGDIDDVKVRVRDILAVHPMTQGALKPKITERLRGWLDVALEQMVTDGEVNLADGGKYTLPAIEA